MVSAAGCATTVVENAQPTKVYSNTEKARMIVEIANGALAEADPTGALQHLARAESMDENLPELHHSKALAYYGKKDLNNAIKSAKRAVEIKPNYSDANNTLGKLLMDAGQNSQAEIHLQVAANDALNREAYKALTNLGIIHYRQSHVELAQKYFDRAITESPNLACVAYYYRGNIEQDRRNFVAAIDAYSSATKKTCAQFVDAQFALGMAYTRNGQMTEAKSMFLDISKRYPKTAIGEKAMEQLRYLP